MFERIRENREQKLHEEQERLEMQIRMERERLMALSEKELMVETILELKKIEYGCQVLSSQCDDIKRTIRVFGN